MALTKMLRKVEVTVQFPSQSISGKEVGIEQFESSEIERDVGEGGREGAKRERLCGRQRWSVCACVRVKRQDTERQS